MRYDTINRKIKALDARLDESERRRAKAERELERVNNVLHSTMHEVRRFCVEVARDADQLRCDLAGDGGGQSAVFLCETIHYTSGMIASRLGFTDLELNPAAVDRQPKHRIGIYKKFDKARYILGLRAREKKTKINFDGQSRLEFEALPAFELVPFVVLDNAIKYSPRDQSIDVSFTEAGQDLEVVVSSMGPVVEDSELESIFDNGTRGRHAQGMPVGGEGRGLFLAKFLCDYHDISLKAKSDSANAINICGIPHATFKLVLRQAV